MKKHFAPFLFKHPISLWIVLWITSNLSTASSAWAWGELGHRIVAEYGTRLAKPSSLANCHLDAGQLVSHTNDPDKVWRQQRRQHPHEAEAHFFHVDRQPADWRRRKTPTDPTQGNLIYRLVDWIQEAKKLRASGNWDALAQTLYGISHYLGDLTQPLHLHHDYDGDEHGLPDLHGQFETKMLNRYEDEARAGVGARIQREGIPALWSQIDIRDLIFDTAVQSNAKADTLFERARPAFQLPGAGKSFRRKKHPKFEPRFVKPVLWKNTGQLAMDQLALGARLWAFVLDSICQ